MGFGTIFATIAMFAILSISSYLFLTGALFGMDTISDSLKAINELDNERFKTEINIADVYLSTTNSAAGRDINVSINNTGSTKIVKSDFKHIDVFVHYQNYTGTENITIHQRMQYNSSLAFSWDGGTLGNNEWTVVQITPDSRNPRVFDPDEQMKIMIRIYPAIGNRSIAMQNRTKIVMPNGVSDEKYF